MPEGDTVWRAAVHLDRALGGTVVEHTEFRVPAFATTDLAGQKCHEVVSRGKFLLMRIGATTVVSHLQMEGSWHLYRRDGDRPRWRRPAHTARAIVSNADWQAVGFSLGRLTLVPTAREPDAVGHLGPDILADDFVIDEAVARLSSSPDRLVFTALLDQRNLAGLGNEYVNEVLFMSGLSPWRPVERAPDLQAVVALAARQIRSHAKTVTRAFTGNPRQPTWVYGRAGQPCRRCGTAIRRSELGDLPTRERIVFWCPTCQP